MIDLQLITRDETDKEKKGKKQSKYDFLPVTSGGNTFTIRRTTNFKFIEDCIGII
jgi:hypothetical protein